MKPSYILLGLLALAQCGFAQPTDSLLKLPEIKDNYYTISESGSKVVYLQMQFGKSEFTLNQLVAINELKGAEVAFIDLVYTDYPAKADFTKLNRKRLDNLLKILPGIFENRKTVFRKFMQTGARNKAEATYLPHGFYIYYRPKPSAAESAREIKKIKKMLGTDVKKDTSAEGKEKTLMEMVCSTWSFYTDTADFHKLEKDFIRKVVMISVQDGIKSKLIDSAYFEYLQDADSAYYVLDVNEDNCNSWDGVNNYESYEKVVEEVFNRNKWDGATIIADVTGSMYPYTTQLMLWLKLKMSDGQKRTFAFFNDGDMKPDAEKVIGKTGGIYKVITSKFDDVEKTMLEAMKNGFGGDAPENNMEALLSTLTTCPSCDTIVLIADNWAPVKDISLTGSFTKPVKIILCGVHDRINPDYLNIARKTKGSIHLIEQDIYELSKMKEGEMIEIKGRKYRIVDGEFKEIVMTRL